MAKWNKEIVTVESVDRESGTTTVVVDQLINRETVSKHSSQRSSDGSHSGIIITNYRCEADSICESGAKSLP